MKIVIIGAGVAGLGVGWRLAQALSHTPGAEVRVLERAQPGSGASAAAAGMLAVTAELLDAHAAEIEFARHSNALWPAFAEELEAQTGRATGYARAGALLLAGDEAGLARLGKRATGDLSMVTPEQARALAPGLGPDFAGALWSPKEALVDAKALAAGLAIAFQKAGGKLISNEAVVRVERQGGRAAIAHTPFGLYHADVFVLAAGAWSGLLEAELAPITPVKGEMIMVRGKTKAEGPVLWGHGVYAVPRGGQWLIGATMQEAGFDTGISAAARNFLAAGAEKLMPGLKGAAITEQWASLRPRAPDGLPLLGPTHLDGLWLAGGQFRNGILFAPAIAEMMAAAILGKGKVIPAFDPRRL